MAKKTEKRILSEGEVVTVFGAEVKVAKPCANADNGAWFCIDHEFKSKSTFEIRDHMSLRGPHRLTWQCNEHGPETDSQNGGDY
jgi:hypothetical protein